MCPRTLSVIALSNRDFSSFEEKIQEALVWIRLAARQGAELVVLPECLNRYCGDGAGHPKLTTPDAMAFEDWRKSTSLLIEAARQHGIYLTIPVINRRDDGLFNSIYLLSPEGETVWCYDKVSPTPFELDAGIQPGQPSYYDWQGVKLGGAICFDSCFPENLAAQAAAEVDLVLFPSLWPGGSQLQTASKLYSLRFAVAYPAWSRIIDLDGKEVIAGGYRQETLRFGFGAPVYTATLNFDRVSLFGNHNQEKIVAILAKYGSKVSITFDQDNCLWFLESRCPDLRECDILEEFALITARDYFAECRRRIAAFGKP